MRSRRTKPRRFHDAVHRGSVRVDISGRMKFTTGRKFCAFGLAQGPRNAKLHRDGTNPFAATYFYEFEYEWRDSQNQSLFFSRAIPRRVIRLRPMNFRQISFIFYLSINKHAWKVRSARIFLCRRFSSMNNN